MHDLRHEIIGAISNFGKRVEVFIEYDQCVIDPVSDPVYDPLEC